MVDKQWVFDNPHEAANLIEKQQQRVDDLMFENSALHREKRELENQNQALAAHNERYRVFVERFCEKVPDTPDNHWIYPSVQVLKRATRNTPETSLAEVRAKQAEASYLCGYCDGLKFEADIVKIGSGISAEKLSKEHANKLRNGKEGE